MPVTVVDFDIRLGNLIGLMVKTAIAVIPALIIVVTIGVIAWSALSSMLVGRHL